MILTLQTIHVGTEVETSYGNMLKFFTSRIIQIPGQIHPGDGGNNFVRNIDQPILERTASHYRRLKSSE
jgi:hypothetical protein